MKAAQLRQSILQAAVQGKLVPQDAHDEHASELLERIRKKKAKLVKEGKIKKEKPLPPIAYDDIPYELPNGWEWCRLGDVGETNIGLTYKPSDVVQTGIPVLRSSNIQEGKICYDDMVCVGTEVPERAMTQKDDLLICARNGSRRLVGKAAIIDKSGMAFGAFMAIYRSAYNQYINIFIGSPIFRENLDNPQTTTINQITQQALKETLCPLPPLSEQKRIVAKVDELLALCDALKAAKDEPVPRLELDKKPYSKNRTSKKAQQKQAPVGMAARGKVASTKPSAKLQHDIDNIFEDGEDE